MEGLKTWWQTNGQAVIGWFTTGAGATIISFLLFKILPTAVSKKVNGFNYEELGEKVAEKVKGNKFELHLRPLVKSELVALGEELNKDNHKHLEKVEKELFAIKGMLSAFASWFEDGVAINDEKKEAFYEASKKANEIFNDLYVEESVELEFETEEKEIKPSKKAQVER